MPVRKRNAWPFSSRKAAPATRARARSSMTVGEAMSAAYKAGQGSGDTGLFDAWLSGKGLHSHGNVLRARLRAEYDRGVESNFEPRARTSPADLNREFVDRSKRRGKKTAEPEVERADAAAVGIDTGRLRAHLGKGGTLAEFQAGLVRNPRQANRFQLIALKYFKQAEEQLGAGRIFVETLRKGRSPHASAYEDGDFYIKIENPTTANKLHDCLHEIAHLMLGHVIDKKLILSRSTQEVDAELWARKVMQAEGVPISAALESETRYNMGYVVKEDRRAGRPVDPRAVEMAGRELKGNPDVTDRAKRYRAQGAIMQTKKSCVICGAPGRLPSDPESNKPRLDVMHLSGNESDGETANLAYGCRSCNAKLSAAFKRIGAGRPTKQYNPSKSAVPSFEQYAWAVSQQRHSGAHGEHGAIIHATPKSKRTEYAKRILRKAWGSRREAHEERWNPADLQYTVWNLKTERPLGGWDNRRFFRGPDGLRFAIEAADKHAADTGDVHLVGGTDSAHYYRTDGGRIKPNPATRRNSIIWEDDGDTQLIRQAEAARSVEELARLHKYAIGRKGGAALLAAVKTRAAALGIRHEQLTAAHPRQWSNPRPANVPKNYEVVSIRNQAQDAADVRSALEAAGIPAVIHEQHLTSTGSPISSPYSVWTPKKTYKRAVKLAEQAYFARHPDRIAPNPVEEFRPRFVPDSLMPALANMWHLSRVQASSRHERMSWTASGFNQEHPEVSRMGAYKDLDGWLAWNDGAFAGASAGRRRNPQDSAAALYESFHGKPADEELLIEEEVHVHENLSVLGRAVECWIDTESGFRACIEFDQAVDAEPIMLCSSEDGLQLYFEGGDQAIDLKALKMDGEEWRKDRMVLGQFSEPEPRGGKKPRKHNLTYNTRKDFDRFDNIDYQHDLGEESGVRPYLEYDPRNQHLYITGGQYFIKQPLLQTSPGIEN